MRFLRGLGIGILMFFIWVIFSVFAAFSFIGEYGLNQELDLALLSPVISIPMMIGFLGMFLGPVYYWVIEPIRDRGKPPRQKYYPPAQQYSSQPAGQQVAAFCEKCGQSNPQGLQFCVKCGASLVLS